MFQKVKYLLIFLLLFAVQNNQSFAQNQKFDSIFEEIDRIGNIKKNYAKQLLDTLYQMIYQDTDSALRMARYLYVEAAVNGRQGVKDTLSTPKIRQRLNRKDMSLHEQAVLQAALAINLQAVGAISEAFTLNYQAAEKFKQLGNNRFAARSLNAMGNICFTIGLSSLAEYYASEALAYVNPQWHEYYFFKVNIITNREEIVGYETTADSLLILLDFAEKEHREELIPLIYVNLGSALLNYDPEKGLYYLNKMQALDFDNPKSRAILNANLLSFYIDKKDYAKAMFYGKEARKTMEQNNDFLNLSFLYSDFAQIYEAQHQYDSAFFYLKKQRELARNIRSNTIAIETHQKYVTTFLEIAQKDLTIAEQKVKIKNNQFIIITVVAGSLIILILLFLLLVNQQKRRKASENRELTAKLEHEKAKSEHEKKVQQYEKRTQKLEREKQQEVLDAKTREITSYSLLVSNKNQLLQQIMELTAQIFNNKENATKTAAKIKEVIQNNLTIDKEWENFKLHFDNVHPNFFEKLKQCCHDLTEENIKMCAYIKMGMTPKQISQLQHVAPRSVIINRYRLKKKLQISEEEDLEFFIGKL